MLTMKRFFRYAKLKLRQWSSDLERVPGFGKVVAKSKTMTLPGLMKVPLYDVMRFFGQSLSKGVVFQRAAAITYRVFVAVIPMIIALFSAIAFFGEDFRLTLMSLLESITPVYVWPAISGMITDVVMRQNGTLSSFMFIIGIYFTIVCINGILVAMTSSYYTEEKRNIFNQIMLSAKLMLLTFLIIVMVAAFFILASLTIRYVHTNYVNNPLLYYFVVHFIKWLLVYAAVYFLISIFYYRAPVKRGEYNCFSAGSSTYTILLVVSIRLLNIYFSNFDN
jgi:membrane protein